MVKLCAAELRIVLLRSAVPWIVAARFRERIFRSLQLVLSVFCQSQGSWSAADQFRTMDGQEKGIYNSNDEWAQKSALVCAGSEKKDNLLATLLEEIRQG